MAIEDPQGMLPPDFDPRIPRILEFVGDYQRKIREFFDPLPLETKQFLIKHRNEHLATGPTLLRVCKNGIIALIQNSLSHMDDVSLSLQYSNPPTETMEEYFNQNKEAFFKFFDPISKLSSIGHWVEFGSEWRTDNSLVVLFICDQDGSRLVPFSSKILLVGWGYLDSPNCETAESMARSSIANAYAVANLRSRSQAHHLLDEYRSLLNNAQSESEIQGFLTQHPEIIYPEFDEVIPKPSLAGERYPDFAVQLRTAASDRWVFVEIENASKRIFTSKDDFQFTSEFTQAKGQLLQWDSIITKDLSFFERRFKGLVRPEFHLIFGRSSELDPNRRDMLLAEFSATNNRKFSTFDDLAHRFENIINRTFQYGVGGS